MLGLGDIVIPGIFVALLLRYDIKHAKGQTQAKGAYFLRYNLPLTLSGVTSREVPAIPAPTV